jgi:hypothetical protein
MAVNIDSGWGVDCFPDNPRRYRPSWEPGAVDISPRTEGRSQKIHFDRLPNITAVPQTINLQATADSGMKVDYFVKVGPASVEGSTLRINSSAKQVSDQSDSRGLPVGKSG